MLTATARVTARMIIRHRSPTMLRSPAGARPAFFVKHSPILDGRRNAGSHVGSSDAKKLIKAARTAHHDLDLQLKLCDEVDDEVETLMEKIEESLDGLHEEIEKTESEREQVFLKQVELADQQRMRELALDNDASGGNTITDHQEPRPARECLRSEGHFRATTPRLDPSTNQIERVHTIDILFVGPAKHTSVVTQVVRNHWWATRVLPMMYLDGHPELVVQAVEQMRAKQPSDFNVYEDWMVRAREEDGLHVTIDDVFMAIATLPAESATRNLLEEHFKHYWQVDVEDYTDLLGEQKETLRLKTMQNTSRAVCDAVHAIFKETCDSV
ncbi:hypothetical protein FN846DRAFT_914123 [Sphaerosporella brunnea]|uniref:Uncharacterized protein n=1 Tax=Sphaerosporella brunnea TaxID=1250544 RepID=A0A5J5ECT7_9PEZI|nr:hypothetical protein FN846DRAFT_914123 [Sphaerosporella brunnea]